MASSPTKIWLKINGDIVKDGQIEINHYATFLQNLQRAVNCLKEVKYPKVDEAYFKLYAGKVYKSSHLTSISTIHQSNFDDDPIFNEINEDIEILIESLIQGDKEFIEALGKSIEDPGEKIKFLKSLKKLLSKNDYKVSVGFSPIKPKKYVRTPSDRENFVDELIKEYTPQASFETFGVITRHKGDEPRNFVVTTTSGEKIVCNYSEEMESYVHEHWKDPIFIKGIISKNIRKNEMDEIISIQPFKKITKKDIGDFQLVLPIDIEVSYDKSKNLWKLSNRSLLVFGRGKTLDKADEAFCNAFERLVVGIFAFNDKNLSEKTRGIKESLKKYINLDDYPHLLDSISFEE
jgi:hypothetical protein